MPTCRICHHAFNSLKFQTEHISICGRCVNTLNESPEPARNAEIRLGEKLARGMQRNAERDLYAEEEWKRLKAKKVLADLENAVALALHGWITRLLEKPENSTRDFKIMRAYRRGLLREEGFADYPVQWASVAHRIRCRDGFKCVTCDATDTTLDVHHIVYLSRHGTNQQNNLITLCRKCHEIEHERLFDLPEAYDPESPEPIRPPVTIQTAASLAAPQDKLGSLISANASLIVSVDANVLSPRQTVPPYPVRNPESTIPSNIALAGQAARNPPDGATLDFGGTRATKTPTLPIQPTNQTADPSSARAADHSRDAARSPDGSLTPERSKMVDKEDTYEVHILEVLAWIFVVILILFLVILK